MNETSFENNDLTASVLHWLAGIDSEIRFWDKWCRSKGWLWPEEFEKRLLENRPFPYDKNLERGCENRVLDVGSGLISFLGADTGLADTTVALSACDPLALFYGELRERYKMRLPPAPEFCFGERLREKYPANHFDIVHMRNALDHSIDPIAVLHNIIQVCKVGGKVILVHNENEAERGHYHGLHQWNITVRDEALVIWSRTGEVNVTEMLSGCMSIQARIRPGKLSSCIATMTKINDAPVFPTGMVDFDKVMAKLALYIASPVYRNLAGRGRVWDFFNSCVSPRLRYQDFVENLRYSTGMRALIRAVHSALAWLRIK